MRIKLFDKIVKKLIAWLMKDEPPSRFPLSDFDRLRHEIRPCDVLLFEGRSRVSEVIKLITQSPWSHAALYIGRLHDIENPILRDRIKEFYPHEDNEQLIIESVLGKGTLVSPLSRYHRDHIRICRPKGISHHDGQQVIGHAIGRLGMDYDVRQIVDLARFLFPWSVIPRRWRSSLFTHNPNAPLRQICSTSLAEAFDSVKFPILPLIKEHAETGIELIPRNPRLFTPKDFDYSPFFEIIKYPIFDMSLSGALYRNLPWNREGTYSNDDGSVYAKTLPQQAKAPESADLDMNDSANATSNENAIEEKGLLFKRKKYPSD
ncbi:MAG: hypothetical protein KIT27_10470 [Legionellales bacterium]|nr:hypothetical protein [Legionellales bacterium]